MALKGIIGDSYAVAENVSINTQKKSFSFDLVVYSDSTKLKVLSSIFITRLDGKILHPLAGELPADVTSGFDVLIQPPVDQPLVEKGIYLSSDKRLFEVIDGKLYYHTTDEGKAFSLAGVTYVCHSNICHKETVWTDKCFDKYFSITKLSETNNNPIKAAYAFLKDQSEFSGLTDA